MSDATPQRWPVTTIHVELPRCPSCGSLDAKIRTSRAVSDDVREAHYRCLCGCRFPVQIVLTPADS